MGSSGGTQVVKYVPVEQSTQSGGSCGGSSCGGSSCDGGGSSASEYKAPAVAKSIAGDTAKTIENQEMERAQRRGVNATYLRYDKAGTTSSTSGNRTLGGS